MRPLNIVHLYRIRLRSRLVQELLALVGIAAGVALLFASQVASTSLTGSVDQLTRAVVGKTRIQVAARGPAGFSQRTLDAVQRVPGVRAAAPILQVHAIAIGPGGERAVDLLGIDPRFVSLSGPQLRRFTANQLARQRAIAVPAPIAGAVGVTFGQQLTLAIGGVRVPALVGAQLQAADIGTLVDSPVVVAPLAYAQMLAGMQGRITRIFVEPDPGQDAAVTGRLQQLVGASLNVRPADYEAQVFRKASAPTNQSTELFSAISALVGFLFAFNAMLLTVPRRQRLVADLRLDGYSARSIVAVLGFDALMLGIVASLTGLALGDVLSRHLFHVDPGYLSYAFLIGSQRIVTWQSVAIAVSGGLVAAGLGVLSPLRDVFARRPASSRRVVSGPEGRSAWPVVAGAACLAVTTVILIAAPSSAVFGMATLTAALVLLLPTALEAGFWLFAWMRGTMRSAVPALALMELRSPTIRARSMAIASTGAVAVFGSVAIQGAHGDLQHGLDNASRDVAAHVWVSPPGSANMLSTTSFHGTQRQTIEHVAGVHAVRIFRGSFLDFDDRRVWVIAQSHEAAHPVPARQLLRGNLAQATARVRRGGWAVISEAIAKDHGLHIGDTFTLPAPRATRLRVAALSTNIGWPPGAVVINSDDYARAWRSTDPSAYDVVLDPGTPPLVGARAVRQALGSNSGLAVETGHQRERRQHAASRAGLSRLTQIATLVLVAAILAMAAATGGMIWQRRVRLAGLKVDGFTQGELWHVLLLESSLLLGAGCLSGAIFGLYGQLLLSRALATVTGFPVVYSTGLGIAVTCFALVTATAVAIVAVPGYLAARVRPAVSFGE